MFTRFLNSICLQKYCNFSATEHQPFLKLSSFIFNFLIWKFWFCPYWWKYFLVWSNTSKTGLLATIYQLNYFKKFLLNFLWFQIWSQFCKETKQRLLVLSCSVVEPTLPLGKRKEDFNSIAIVNLFPQSLWTFAKNSMHVHRQKCSALLDYTAPTNWNFYQTWWSYDYVSLMFNEQKRNCKIMINIGEEEN